MSLALHNDFDSDLPRYMAELGAAARVAATALARAGTTGLTRALGRLGFPDVHYPTRMAEVEAHAGATDVSVVAMRRELDPQALDAYLDGS